MQHLARDTQIIGAECLEACTYQRALSFMLVHAGGQKAFKGHAWTPQIFGSGKDPNQVLLDACKP